MFVFGFRFLRSSKPITVWCFLCVQFDVTIMALDTSAQRLSATKSFTVIITNVNEAPVFANATAPTVSYFSLAPLFVLTTLSATDPEGVTVRVWLVFSLNGIVPTCCSA